MVARTLSVLGALVLLALPGRAQRDAPAPPPASPFPVAAFGAHPPTGPAPLTVEFVDRSYGEVTSWSWDFGDGTTSSQRNPSHVYAVGGFYTVRLSVQGPGGVDEQEKPNGVIVTSCTVGNARANRGSPLERGEDFVPITGDDSLGFYVVYSGKAVTQGSQAIANNVGLFLFPLVGDEVLLFGAGYGDPNSFVDTTRDAAYDVLRIDTIIRFCLGRDPQKTRIRFVAPHGHIDHINADCMRELRARGYTVADIVFHAADGAWVRNLPGWKPGDRGLFRELRNSTFQCQEELASYASPLGKLWLHLRAGHTPGSLDLVIDVQNDPGNRFVVRGSGGAFGSCPVPGVREAVEPHGNILLTAKPPVLEALSPAHGSSIGGTTISLFGTGFAAPGAALPQVFFGGAPATSVNVLDDGALTCRAPAGAPGTRTDLRIVTRNGSDTLADVFLYRPLPTVTSVQPARGLASGGTSITLRGTGFLVNGAGPNTVSIGGREATAVSVIDDTTLTCVTPPGGPGLVVLRLANLNGTAQLSTGFTFDPVVEVTSVSPIGGTSLGGTRVTVNGSHFGAATAPPRVFFGAGEGLDLVRVSDTKLLVTTPPGPVGTWVDVHVLGENGGDTLSGGFRFFVTPTVASVVPDGGPAPGGTVVTLNGANFTRNDAGPCTVTFGGRPATSVVALSDTALRCTTPSGTGGAAVEVRVSNVNGAGTLANAFRYRRVPVLSGLEPPQGPFQGGTLVTLHGGAFSEVGAGTPTVTFGGRAASEVSVLDDTTLRCRTPTGTSGATVDVGLANANGQAALAGAFRFVTVPVVSGVSPLDGPAKGGTTLTVHGSGFQAAGAGATLVTLAHLAADELRVLDDATLTVRTPPGAPGTSVGLVLVNQNGKAELPVAYRYRALPELTALSPASGPPAGGTRVRLAGRGFLAGGVAPRIAFAGVPAANVLVLDDATAECDTPPGADGAADVRFTNADGSAVLHEGFVYGSTKVELLSLSPPSGTSLGGTAVELTGSGFTSARAGTNQVTFGGQPAGAIVALNDTRLNATAPPGTPGATVDVRVQNGNGTSTLAGAYRYHRRPTLASLAPDNGPAGGGTLVTLRGTGFQVDAPGATTVRFGGRVATQVNVLDDGTLTCRTPSGTHGGAVDVELVNANGSAALALGFRYHAAPTLSALTPGAGSPQGGVLVTLTGAGFALDGAGTTTVTFGGVPATQVAVVDDHTVTCRSPAGAANALVDVRLQNANGASTLSGAYRTFAAPTIANLAPNAGPPAGGTQVTLQGTGFQTNVTGATTVTFGGVAGTGLIVVDDTRVRASAPAGVGGSTVEVRLVNSNGSVAAAERYRYHAAPVLQSLSPAGGSSLGGLTVTLTGSGFQKDNAGANTVLFGAAPAPGVVVVDDLTLRCLVPVGTPGAVVDVRLQNANGSSTRAAAFQYFAQPVLGAVVPAFGFSGGGATVELHGSGFQANAPGANEVRFGASAATAVTVVSDGVLRCQTPAGAPGPVAVTLTNANGTSSLAPGFEYDFAPTVHSFLPTHASSLGGTEVRIEGGGFATAGAGLPAVRFGVTPATDVRVLDGLTILCTLPAGAAGSTVDVSVSNANGSSSLAGFRYHVRPTLTSVDPARGSPSGGSLVTLRGTGFVADGAGPAQVTFAGQAASGIVVVDDTTLRCLTPPGAARTQATIVVQNTNGGAALASAFRYAERLPSDLDDDGLADAALSGVDAVFLFFGDALLADKSSLTPDLAVRAATPGVDFGASTACADLNGDQRADLVVGAPLDDGGGADAGAVYVFFGPFSASATPRLSSTASAVFRGQSAGDHFGAAIALGDVNGDTLPDLVVGAPSNDQGAQDAGAVYVFRGRTGFASLPATGADVRLTGTNGPDAFGAAVGTGDVDGDGRGDLLVGAPQRGASGGSSGAAFVFRGGPALAGGSANLAQIVISGDSGDRFGSAILAADVDGDDIGDLCVCASEADRTADLSGSVFVYRGGAGLRSGATTTAQSILDAEAAGDRLGTSIAAGDADGDGRADLLIGAPQHDVPAANGGRAYLVFGGLIGNAPVDAAVDVLLLAENSAGDSFGTAVALGDLDGDGRDDLLVGAPFANAGVADCGRVYVFLGSGLAATRSAAADDATFTGSQAGLTLGKEIAGGR